MMQNAFKISLKQRQDIEIGVNSEGFSSMRHWQVEAFDVLKDASLMILNAPMGSGKSWMMCLLSAYKMRNNSALRSIIAVPQTIIAPGFTDEKFKMPNGECIHWCIDHNLCKEGVRNNVKYIIRWLSRRYQSFRDRALLCTHATLVRVYQKLQSTGQLQLLQDLLVWIDEAHHVKNVSMVDVVGETISNGIGKLVKHFTDTCDEMGMQLGLTTASFFRGDRCSLITPTMEEQFSRFNLPYDEYLQSMKYLKSFSFDFMLCGQEYTSAIGVLAKARKSKDIIYVPHPKSRHSTGDKYREVKNIFAEYQKIHGGELIDASNGLTLLQGSKGSYKILDLVDEDRRLEKKEFLNCKDLQKQRDSLDAIIALGMFKEGANWIWADRSIIVGVRASLVDIMQMMGRLFRDAEEKYHVEVVQLLPFSLEQTDDGFQDSLNNYLKAIYASLILEDVLSPVLIKVPSIPSERKTAEEGLSENQTRPLMSNLIPDESMRLSVIEDVVKYLTDISVKNKKEGKGNADLYKEYQKGLLVILPKKYGFTKDVETIGNVIWNQLLRRSLQMQGLLVEDIDFNIIMVTHPLEGLLRYTSGSCGVDTLEKLRDAIHASTPEFTREQLKGWIGRFIETHGKKPNKRDGIVEFTGSDFKGITWNAINTALNRGNRSFSPGSSLASFTETEFGIKNPKRKPTLSEDGIRELIQNFIARHGRKPQKTDGLIEHHEGNLSWQIIDRRLRDGNKGLSGGSSLAIFSETHFGIRDQVKIPEVSLDLIRFYIQKHFAKYKKYPTSKSGKIEFAEGELKGISWHSVNQAIKAGKTSLPKGSTLADYIQSEFGVTNPKNPKLLSEEIVLSWIQKFIDKNGKKPNVNDGVIEFADSIFPALTWRLLNNCLSKGRRGFSGGSSLAKLIEVHFKIKNRNQSRVHIKT